MSETKVHKREGIEDHGLAEDPKFELSMDSTRHSVLNCCVCENQRDFVRSRGFRIYDSDNSYNIDCDGHTIQQSQ